MVVYRENVKNQKNNNYMKHRFKDISWWIAISIVILPSFILPVFDHWMGRLIAAFLLFNGAVFICLFTAFNFKQPLASRPLSRNANKITRSILAMGGFAGIIWVVIPYTIGVLHLASNGWKLEKMVGVVENTSTNAPVAFLERHIKIKGDDKKIYLLYPMGKIYKITGTTQEFSLLPGTRYALDVRPAKNVTSP
jgi:hypothetical protein